MLTVLRLPRLAVMSRFHPIRAKGFSFAASDWIGFFGTIKGYSIELSSNHMRHPRASCFKQVI